MRLCLFMYIYMLAMLACPEPFNMVNLRQMGRPVNYFCKPLLLACRQASFPIDSVLAELWRFHQSAPPPVPGSASVTCVFAPLTHNTNTFLQPREPLLSLMRADRVLQRNLGYSRAS